MPKQKILVAPSILAANQVYLLREAKRVEKAGADLLHVDVMDGRFVPRAIYGVEVVKKLGKSVKLPLDVHLMIAEPWKHVHEYAKAGAKRICVHVEAGSAKQILQTIKLIKKSRCKAGLAINPPTPLQVVDPALLKASDFIMPMTVNPGAAGQEFMHSVLPKIDHLNSLLRKMKLKKELEADGGVTPYTAPILASRGVRVLVSGAGVFQALDAKAVIRQLRGAKPVR